MNKADLIEAVAARTRRPQADTAKIVNELIAAVGRALSEGREIQLRRFGAFRIRRRGSREMRNPRTGETYRVPAKIVPLFRASRALTGLVGEAGQPGNDGGERPPAG
jgi:nucleoid DNA-binding protein